MVTNKDTLKQAYSTNCTGIIWKIALDEQKDIIAWECRTLDKKVTFYAYDFVNKTELLHNFSFEENWLLSLTQVKNGIAYFNSYESASSPVQKGIIALDLKTKKILWQNFSVSIHLISEEGVLVFDSKILPRKYQLLNFITGGLERNIIITQLTHFSPIGNHILLPQLNHGTDILNSNYLLNFNNLNIKSYFKKLDQKINQFITIENNERIVFSEIINEDIQKLSFDTFFVWHNLLVYIRNKSEIVSYFV